MIKNSLLTKNKILLDWVQDVERLCQPDEVYWCDGSLEEKERLTQEAVDLGILEPLNPKYYDNCFYHRSKKDDVARVENLTFICTLDKDDVGPTNNWMAPNDAKKILEGISKGSMKGRKLYIVPFLMGPPNSSISRVGVQCTDSLYVVLSMGIMTRMGQIALEELEKKEAFTKCFHATASLNPKERYICHFPEEDFIWSVGSNYGGNALLSKKCFALRIASYQAQKELWMAEHMLTLGVKAPNGKIYYFCAAFPSHCGKTNLAMIRPPASMKGYEVFTLGDDITWLYVDDEGQLCGVNPEAGFFGVVPGTNQKTNSVAMETIKKNTIYTNVGLTKDKKVWWEGLDNPPDDLVDWQGNDWNKDSNLPAAHPNSRYTVSIKECPQASSEIDSPKGVPISGIIFGGRRNSLIPLVFETLSWNQGVYMGSMIASESTSAQSGEVGILRRDPMAMLPFAGYHMGDYFSHWIEMGKKLENKPSIFHVNWFKQDDSGEYLWPGFNDNLRVIEWMIDCVEGKAQKNTTPIGYVPDKKGFNVKDLPMNEEKLDTLLQVDNNEWLQELNSQENWLKKLGSRVPKALWNEYEELGKRLK